MAWLISRARAGRSARRLIAVVPVLATLVAATPAHAAGGRRVRLQPAAALPADGAVARMLPSRRSLHITVALRPRDAAALAHEAAAVSDPGSPDFHRYLTVGGFARRFGADRAARGTVAAALRRYGLTVGAVSPNGLSLQASGTVSQVERAFATRLRRVRLAGGAVAYADTTAPTLDTAAAADVQAVTGLDTLPASAPIGLARAHRRPVSRLSADGASASVCPPAGADGYTPSQIAAAYGLNGLWAAGDLGAGTTVGLFELEPYTASDVTAYGACFASSSAITNVTVDGGSSCGNDANCGAEDELDIEDVAGLAPGAAIRVYEGPNTGGGALDTYAAMVQARSVNVISTSWGICETAEPASVLQAENTLFEEAATQGKTVLAASGDDGAAGCDTDAPVVDDPASQPWVTGVGATRMGTDSATGQTVWNDAEGATGGGVSQFWSAPSWQTQSAPDPYGLTCTTTPGATSTSSACREVPDVSADGDPETGYPVFYDGRWTEYGGTSAAAPTWGALIALADSSRYCAAPVGFANAALYALPSADFADVTSGTNTVNGVGFDALPGYDMASGLGVPNGATLVPGLCGSGATVPEPTTTSTPVVSAGPTTPVAVTSTTPTTTSTTTAQPGRPVTTAPVPTRPGASVTVSGPAHRVVGVGRRVRVVVHASDRLGLRVHYVAWGLPRGLRIDRTTGAITGIPRRAGRVTSVITATDAAGRARRLRVRWTVTARR